MKKRWITWSLIAASLAAEVYLLLHVPAVLLALTFCVGRSDCSFQKTIAVANWKMQYLDSEKRMEALSRRVRTEDGIELWSTPRGDFWYPANAFGPMTCGVLAEEEMQVYGSGKFGVQPGDVVIDCGADVGTFTRAALDMGASLVVAAEPASEKLPCLRRTFQQEIANGRVQVYPKGLWDKEDSLLLYGDSVVEKRSAHVEVVRLTTIDNLVEELKLDRVNFIKMDIEGAEAEALEGARRTLARFRPRLAISTEHSIQEARNVRSTVRNLASALTPTCGPCAYLSGRICPHVLYFQ